MKSRPHTRILNSSAEPLNASGPGSLDLKIIQVAPSNLKPHPRNARTHSRKQILTLEKSIRKFGFVTPVLIDSNGVIIADHARVQAAKAEGLTSVPCVRVDHLSKDEIRAYMLAENVGWDQELLAQELSDLNLTMPDFDFDPIGFSIAETDSLIAGLKPVEDGDPADDLLPKIPKGPPRCCPGERRHQASD